MAPTLPSYYWKKATKYTASSAAVHRSIPTALTICTRIRTSEPQKFRLHYGDLTDSSSLLRVIQEVQPDEIYNLAAQSHVAVSFESPEYTANVDGFGALRILEAIRILGLQGKTRFYQASTSEFYGLVQEVPQTEGHRSIRVAHMRCKNLCVLDHDKLSRGLRHIRLQRHFVQPRMPIRGETFVTRKITRALARIDWSCRDCLYLGNLDAMRDWGHARDYVEMQWLMLQQDQPRRLCDCDRRAT